MSPAPTLIAQPITRTAFASFGEVVETADLSPILINDGLCRRFTDLASFDIAQGRIGLSLFRSELRQMPYSCALLERHPLGSQCFIPMGASDYLVIVAPDDGGKPGVISAFVANGEQAVNIARNTWHGVLAPVSGSGLFAVIDRIGDGPNLEEHRLARPVWITQNDPEQPV